MHGGHRGHTERHSQCTVTKYKPAGARPSMACMAGIRDIGTVHCNLSFKLVSAMVNLAKAGFLHSIHSLLSLLAIHMPVRHCRNDFHLRNDTSSPVLEISWVYSLRTRVRASNAGAHKLSRRKWPSLSVYICFYILPLRSAT